MNFLITGGWCRTSLALIHSLPVGSNIVIGSHFPFSMSFFSKRIAKTVLYNDPELSHGFFIDDILKIVRKNKIEVIIPSLEEGFLISKYIDLFEGVAVRFPRYDVIDLCSDKFKFYNFCVDNDFPVAHGEYITIKKSSDFSSVDFSESRYVIKYQFSNGGKGVFDSKDVKKSFLTKFKYGDTLLVQDFVDGFGLTVEGIWDGSNCDCLTVRKTYRFKIPIGGAAVIIQNAIHDEAVRISRSIMSSLNYRGPAQIEFIIDANGSPVLIEINPRWWGTTPFNYNLGKDFSNYLVNDVIRNSAAIGFQNKVGVWYLGFIASLFTYNFNSTLKLIVNGKLFPAGKKLPIDFVENDYLPLIVQFFSYPLNIFISRLKGAKRVVFRGS